MCPFARYLVLLVSAGIIGGAALGLAGAATTSIDPLEVSARTTPSRNSG